MLHVGTPRLAVAVMRRLPMWKKLAAVGHTLPWDLRTLGDAQHGKPLPPERFAAMTIPALIMAGSKSPDWMRTSARAIAETLADATYEELPGQTHMVKAKALAPPVTEFLGQATPAPARPGSPGSVPALLVADVASGAEEGVEWQAQA